MSKIRKIIEIGKTIQGLKQGLWLTYDHKTLVKQSNFKDDLEDGETIYYNFEGTICSVVNYNKGKRNGVTIWLNQGDMHISDYKDGIQLTINHIKQLKNEKSINNTPKLFNPVLRISKRSFLQNYRRERWRFN